LEAEVKLAMQEEISSPNKEGRHKPNAALEL